MSKQQYVLIGGPLDGATEFKGSMVTFPDGEISAQLRGPLPYYRLWYRGVVAFCGRPAKLYFEPGPRGRFPVKDIASHIHEDFFDHLENTR